MIKAIPQQALNKNSQNTLAPKRGSRRVNIAPTMSPHPPMITAPKATAFNPLPSMRPPPIPTQRAKTMAKSQMGMNAQNTVNQQMIQNYMRSQNAMKNAKKMMNTQKPRRQQRMAVPQMNMNNEIAGWQTGPSVNNPSEWQDVTTQSPMHKMMNFMNNMPTTSPLPSVVPSKPPVQKSNSASQGTMHFYLLNLYFVKID